MGARLYRRANMATRVCWSEDVTRVPPQPGGESVSKLVDAFRVSDWTLNRIDPDGLRYMATVSVRVHWFLSAVVLVETVYRAHYRPTLLAAYLSLLLLLAGFNGFVYHRLRSSRPITWRLIQAVFTVDLFTISAAAAISNGFNHPFIHLFSYPLLAGFAVMFTSFRPNIGSIPVGGRIVR